MPIASYHRLGPHACRRGPQEKSLREPELGPVRSCGDLYNCLLSALFLSFFPLLSSSAQNTDSFTVSGA